MEVRELALPGLLELRPKIFSDDRGYFFESYNYEQFSRLGISEQFVQDNQSFSVKGVVRGLHLQSDPMSQGKLVRAVVGTVLDVALDIRVGSPTFGRHLAVILDSEQQNMLYIPPGFAHGFSALTDCIFQYKCTNAYSKENEMGIHPIDKNLAINWQVPNPIISSKDEVQPLFNSFVSPFKW